MKNVQESFWIDGLCLKSKQEVVKDCSFLDISVTLDKGNCKENINKL